MRPFRRHRAAAMASVCAAALACTDRVVYVAAPRADASMPGTDSGVDSGVDAGPIIPCPSELVGFATLAPGTSGGAGGPTMPIMNQTDLDNAGRMDGPMILQIQGMITVSDQADITHGNKTVEGIGPNAGLMGGGLRVKATSNVIIRNLKIVNAFGTDAITLETADHVWVDHCDLSSAPTSSADVFDDLIDITRGSDFVTVSWTRMHDHAHDVSVIGNSDMAAADDMGKLHVTLHHNLFANNPSHNPSVRFGRVHAFSNYHVNIPGIGIASRMGAIVRVEDNYFDNVGIPLTTHFESPMDGYIQDLNDNVVMNSGASSVGMEMPLDLMGYPYSPTAAADVPALVDRCAGVDRL